jgi:hypothetical protein
VHKGDIKNLKNLVYSQNWAILWEKNGNKMIAMTKNTIPANPSLMSKKSEKQYQYNYMVMNMTGVNSNGCNVVGEVKMIVENGVWKVYQEIWRQRP